MSPKDWPQRYGKRSPANNEEADAATTAIPPKRNTKRKLQPDFASDTQSHVPTESSVEPAASDSLTADHDTTSDNKKAKVHHDAAALPPSRAASPVVAAAATKFIYGNYDHYYGYRNSRQWEDARMTFFDPCWFESKAVLDLGCNAGLLSILVASTDGFAPSRVVGIDIDQKLIAQAKEKLQQRANFIAAQEQRTRKKTAFNDAPISSLSRFAAASASSRSRGASIPPSDAPAAAAAAATSFPSNVSFELGDLLTSPFPPSDVILCMSVTKWIHFHHGDDGIRAVFAKIARALTRGGRLILEPQPWKTYKKKAGITEEIKKTYKEITLRSRGGGGGDKGREAEASESVTHRRSRIFLSPSLCPTDLRSFPLT